MAGEGPGAPESEDELAALGVLWGKSAERAGGRKNLLLEHLLDTAAVAECMWDGFLAPSTRRLVDELAGGAGRGRRFFAWLCGIHDIGKATPAFQRMWPEGAAAVRAAGLLWSEPAVAKHAWRHDRAGAYVLRRLLPPAGWAAEHVEWMWPLIAGHHGAFPSPATVLPPRQGRGQHAGGEAWARVQDALLRRFTAEVGAGAKPGEMAPARLPSRAAQLHLSGLIVMADWIASDEEHFPGVDNLTAVTVGGARRRAAAAWRALGVRGGWGRLAEPVPEDFGRRFNGQQPRDSQRMVMEAARRMPEPGLLVVEAPMGEGKTKAALMAAEILAARFGADGVFVGMPTQATSDPMFGHVRAWVGAIDEELADQVALLHGKRMFNKEWQALVAGGADDGESRFGGVDEYGECGEGDWGDDLYGLVDSAQGGGPAARGPAEWFLGSKRGLLCPFVVGTIDQLLFAATRTKHVMLRMAGLAGKVVVLDEVHAADVYMSQFLAEGLRWLGQARVPVVLLSATLPPAQRRVLTEAYLAGAASQEEYMAADFREPAGYPSVIAASMPSAGGGARIEVSTVVPWRRDMPPVAVEVLPESVPQPKASAEKRNALQRAADEAVAARLERELLDGGCALVIRNTVARAQGLFTRLREQFGADVVLLHGRLAVGPRADRTDQCLLELGPSDDGKQSPRPRRIVVATQLAEQSFDVDADILVTDLAPMDLLLQRIGRLHRHDGVRRPSGLSCPRVLVTGFEGDGKRLEASEPPAFLYGSQVIYGRHLLLRTAVLVLGAAAGSGWRIPSDVPELVSACYSEDLSVFPDSWDEAAEAARADWRKEQRDRADTASPYLLTRRGDKESPTLAGLHGGAGSGRRAPVRDGDTGLEAVLIRGGTHGTAYRALSGRALTVNGDVPDGMLDDVLAGTVRLPPQCTEDAARELRPLPAWIGHPRLRYAPALVLDSDGSACVGEYLLTYDDELGLIVAKRT